ncbi:MAG: NAD(P)-dependent oxidoreductase [Chloroflexi bacterium]|nr:NAD(P)-dependent oxidoreductase [Chloroflexota bacterium]
MDEYLSRHRASTVEALAGLDGDLLVLGAGGKMGLSFAAMAARSLRASGSSRRVIAVSRFHDGVERFHAAGVETIAADLMDDTALAALPDASNVLFLAGMKFGSSGARSQTWAMNVLLPGLVARRYPHARTVALSTGNVYPFTDAAGPGCREEDEPAPVGEYALTCLGRERMFEHQSRTTGMPVALIRLNYANALRYGVLVDICQQVLADEPVDVAMGSVNVIWQGDACAAILDAFGMCASPPAVLNVTGPETVRVRTIAERFAALLGRPAPRITGTEAPTALLSDASRMRERSGAPQVPLDQLLAWTAEWVARGRPLLGKPTGFQTRDGRF